MGQAGLHIPAFDGSELGIFREIYADIGWPKVKRQIERKYLYIRNGKKFSAGVRPRD